MNKELISIAVIAFNSERTILDTLNSILAQDYGSRNIELIISDDGSTDKTNQIVTIWLNKYNSKFGKIIVNFVVKNKGIVNNFNTVCKLATSNWIKIIAADDVLYPNCISELYNYATENNHVECLFCKIEKFNDSGKMGIFPKKNLFFNSSAEKQFINLLIDNFAPAPGSFFKSSILKKIGYADLNYNIIEDYPLWLKLTSYGIKLYLLDKPLVGYRLCESVSNKKDKLINEFLNYEVYICKKDNLKKIKNNKFFYYLLLVDIYLFRFSNLIIINVFKNKKNILVRKFCSAIRLFSLIFIARKFIQLLSKNQ
ncbi:glycosyltransferase [Arsenophonus nasoniae]|uniref:Glycosyltransferase n=1 Tax=Arsenophonus nasoniae TaxID=638 RepID=A0AA95GIA9_9GAMM|nr:glycosyltransferase [Arsenophonus nasoniae]WGL97015.1 glycosyltransferase [Arsenophonus nasoniae]